MTKSNKPVQQNPTSGNSNKNVVSAQFTSVYSHFLPPPDVLERFEKMRPGITDELLQLAKQQSANRISLEQKVVNSNVKNSNKGLNFGFIIALVGILSSVAAMYLGFEIGGSVLGGSTILGLVYAFIYGSRKRIEELAEKREKFK